MRRPLAIGALLLVVVALATGCGEKDEPDGFTPARVVDRAANPAETRAVRATIAKLEAAIARGDAPAICRLYTEDARQTEVAVSGTSCERGVSADLKGEKAPRLSVGKVEVTASRRHSFVMEAGAPVTSRAAGRKPFKLDAILVTERGSWHLHDGVLDYVLPPRAESGYDSGSSAEDDAE
jgi:hypothetical protein